MLCSSVLCLMLLSPPARAQQAATLSASSDGAVAFNVQTYRPAFPLAGLYTLDGSALPGRLNPVAGVVFDYARVPLRLVQVDSGDAYANTVPDLVTTHVQAGLGLIDALSLSVSLPIVVYQGFDARTPISVLPYTPTAGGLGDLRVGGKLRIVQGGLGRVGVALAPQMTLPTGAVRSLRSDGTVAIEPRLVIDYVAGDGSRFVMNVGYYARTYNRSVDYGLVRVADLVRYGVGGEIALRRGFFLGGELAGAVAISRIEGGPLYAPLEALAGGRYRHGSGVEISLAAGGPFLGAVGIPSVRVVAGVQYSFSRGTTRAAARPGSVVPPAAPAPPSGFRTPAERDPDGDSVMDSEDLCPTVPGSLATRGCPDYDGDGVPDSEDRCPTLAGDPARGGCPAPQGKGSPMPTRTAGAAGSETGKK